MDVCDELTRTIIGKKVYEHIKEKGPTPPEVIWIEMELVYMNDIYSSLSRLLTDNKIIATTYDNEIGEENRSRMEKIRALEKEATNPATEKERQNMQQQWLSYLREDNAQNYKTSLLFFIPSSS